MIGILRHRWVQLIIGCTIVFALFLVLLPYGLRYGIQRFVLAGGAEKIVLEDIDFNPFTGSFAVKDLEIHAGNKIVLRIPRVALQLAYGELPSRHLLLKKVQISGHRMTVEQLKDGRWKVHGLSPLGGEEEAKEKGQVSSAWAAGIR